MRKSSGRKIIQRLLLELAERDLFDPIHDIFLIKGYQVWITHGSTQLGKDLVATKRGKHNFIISVKKGKIDKRRWDTEVEPQLKQLMQTSVSLGGVDESLPRLPLLIVIGNLTLQVSRMLKEFNDYYSKHREAGVEVWELERLTSEIHDYLLGVTLIGKKYSDEFFEDIQRLILSIKTNSFNKDDIVDFVNKYLKFEKFSIFKLSFVYALRRCEKVENHYAFFYFAEIALLKCWKDIYQANNFSLVEKFDEIHQLYIEGLENWSKLMESLIKENHGFYKHGKGLSEFVEYPLRVFDALRRFSYLALYLYRIKSLDKLKLISHTITTLMETESKKLFIHSTVI